MTLDTFQLGDARGAPRDRRHTALPPPRPGRELHHPRRGAPARAPHHRDIGLGLGARALRREPDRQRRPALRRRGARRCEAEPDPQRQRPRRRGRQAADPRLVRRAGPVEPAERRIRLREAHLALPPPSPQGRDARRTSRWRAESLRAQVWDEVREKQARMGVRSETAANRDTFEAHGARLRALEQAFAVAPGQCGAVLGLGDDLCLDAVSRPDAFALLWPKLRAGYLLDALERLDRRADVGRAHLGIRRRGRRGARHARAVGRARRGHACSRRDRHRLGAHARRRDDPALGVHELGRRRARLREDCPAEPPTLKRVGLLRR